MSEAATVSPPPDPDDDATRRPIPNGALLPPALLTRTTPAGQRTSGNTLGGAALQRPMDEDGWVPALGGEGEDSLGEDGWETSVEAVPGSKAKTCNLIVVLRVDSTIYEGPACKKTTTYQHLL